MRWPHRVRLRLELDSLCVRNSVAQLQALSAANRSGDRVEALDRQFFAAKLFQRDAVILQLFLRLFLASFPVDEAILLPPEIEDPSDRQQRNPQRHRRIKEWILQRAFRLR